MPVLLARDLLEVEAVQRGERGKPCVDVAELLFEVLLVLAPHGAHQLADLLDEPQQRSRHAARSVAVVVEILDQPLERPLRRRLLRPAHAWPAFFTVTSRTSSRRPSAPASCSMPPSTTFMNMFVRSEERRVGK